MSPHPQDAVDAAGRRIGVIAVIERHGRLLVIRRAAGVRKEGKVCFPGGGLRVGEQEAQGVVREVAEELGASVAPLRRLERSRSPWGTSLSWWHCRLVGSPCFRLDPREIGELFWETADRLAEHPDLLESNHEFLARLVRGVHSL